MPSQTSGVFQIRVDGELVWCRKQDGGFPQAAPELFAITNSIDDTLQAPYTMNMNFSIGREFGHGFFVQGAYVGRLSRRSLITFTEEAHHGLSQCSQ